MRTLQILTLALLATAARADRFDVTFTAISVTDGLGDPEPLFKGFPFSSTGVGIGHFETDGVCQTCSSAPDGGMLDFSFVDPPLGAPTVPTYQPVDPLGFKCCGFIYDRQANTLAGGGCTFGNECIFVYADGIYFDDGEGDVPTNGVYSIAQAVPEPCSIDLLLIGLALIWPLAIRKL
jgi:hypothetical protein